MRASPTSLNGYIYEGRYGKGAQYPLIVRRKEARGGQEEIVLDVGALAALHPQQYRLGAGTVSPDNTRAAFTVDFSGNIEYRIFVRTIATGAVIDQGIDNAASSLVFAADSETLFYVRDDPTTFRSYQVWRHRIGSDANRDVLVYEEGDPTFSVSLELSKSRKLILLDLDAERTSEFRYLPVDRQTEAFKIIDKPSRASHFPRLSVLRTQHQLICQSCVRPRSRNSRARARE